MDCMKILIRDIKEHCPNLTREEQIEASKLWLANGDLEARERLILSILPWAVNIAKSYQHTTQISLSDLASVAFEGAIAAVDRFDPNMGFALTTFSSFWIRQKLLRYVQDNWTVIRAPAHARQKIRDMRKSQINVRSDNPSIVSAERVNPSIVSAERVAKGVFSLDAMPRFSSDDDDGDFGITIKQSLLAKDRDPETAAIESEEVGILQEHLDRLPERMRYVFQERLNGVTLRKIGLVLGVTRERVRQIEVKARRRLLDSFRERVGRDG